MKKIVGFIIIIFTIFMSVDIASAATLKTGEELNNYFNPNLNGNKTVNNIIFGKKSTYYGTSFAWEQFVTYLDADGGEKIELYYDERYHNYYVLSSETIEFNESSNKMFYQYEGTSITFDDDMIDTSKVTDMSNMFNKTSLKEELNLSQFKTENVTNMSYMFSSLNVDIVGLEKFSTSNVIHFDGMFSYYSGNLGSFYVPSFYSAMYTNDMFKGCKTITYFYASSTLKNIINMNSMFEGCTKLTIVSFANGSPTLNLKVANNMFKDCTSLETVYLNSFYTANLLSTGGMFENCSSLKNVYVSNLWMPNSISLLDGMKSSSGSGVLLSDTKMFTGATNISGLYEADNYSFSYDPNYIDKTYAKANKGKSDPGYFTCQSNDYEINLCELTIERDEDDLILYRTNHYDELFESNNLNDYAPKIYKGETIKLIYKIADGVTVKSVTVNEQKIEPKTYATYPNVTYYYISTNITGNTTIKFETMNENDIVPGDVSLDGVFQLKDLSIMRKLIVKQNANDKQLLRGDANNNGSIDGYDMLYYMRLYARATD